MILSGREIKEQVRSGGIVIEPYDSARVEPNSYGFSLGEQLLVYDEAIIDPSLPPLVRKLQIPESGFVLIPGQFYLGHTHECIGGVDYASELYANLSTAACGIFVQTSAPLGHTGAIINWTLEITVAQKVRIYPRMRIGKICFWRVFGDTLAYSGRYSGSNTVIQSRISKDDAE